MSKTNDLVIKEVVLKLKQTYIDINDLLQHLECIDYRDIILDDLVDLILTLDSDDWRDNLDIVRTKNKI